MNKKLSIIGGAIFVVIILFFVFKDSSIIKNYPPQQGPIVAFGDSLVFGYGATPGNDFVSILSRKIGEPIINLGVSGDTTAGGLERVNEVVSEKPRITLVLLGGNDFLRKVDRAQSFNNLRLIISRIQDSGSIVVLLGVRGGLLINSADGLYEDLAKETHSAYVPDVLNGLFADSRYMFDGMHPNDRGYAKIADKIYPILSKLLR